MKILVFFIILFLLPIIFINVKAQTYEQKYIYPLESSPYDIPYKKWPIIYWQKFIDTHNKTTSYDDKCHTFNFNKTIFLVNPFSISKAKYDYTFSNNNS